MDLRKSCCILYGRSYYLSLGIKISPQYAQYVYENEFYTIQQVNSRTCDLIIKNERGGMVNYPKISLTWRGPLQPEPGLTGDMTIPVKPKHISFRIVYGALAIAPHHHAEDTRTHQAYNSLWKSHHSWTQLCKASMHVNASQVRSRAKFKLFIWEFFLFLC